MVVLILKPYDLQFVVSSQNELCLLEKERVRIKSLKNLYGQLFSKYFPQDICLVVRRTTRSEFLVVLIHFMVVEDTRTREFCFINVLPCITKHNVSVHYFRR